MQQSLSYAIVAWGHSSGAGDILRAERRAIRIMACLELNEDCKERFIIIL